jgi:hypothetical protein
MHLIALCGFRGAWVEAREGLQDALENRQWLDEDELRRRRRYWNSVRREIEREIGLRRQRGLLRNMEER